MPRALNSAGAAAGEASQCGARPHWELIRLDCPEADRRNLPLLATLELVAQLLPLLEVAHSRVLDCRDVHKHVLRAVVGLDETVTFLGIKPLYSTVTHRSSSIRIFSFQRLRWTGPHFNFGKRPRLRTATESGQRPRRNTISQR